MNMTKEKEERVNRLCERISDIEIELARLKPMQAKARTTTKRYKKEIQIIEEEAKE